MEVDMTCRLLSKHDSRVLNYRIGICTKTFSLSNWRLFWFLCRMISCGWYLWAGTSWPTIFNFEILYMSSNHTWSDQFQYIPPLQVVFHGFENERKISFFSIFISFLTLVTRTIFLICWLTKWFITINTLMEPTQIFFMEKN